MSLLTRLLDVIAVGCAPEADVILYGPRGNGTTVFSKIVAHCRLRETFGEYQPLNLASYKRHS